MPSESMDSRGFSSSFFSSPSGDLEFLNERQVGFWKSDGVYDNQRGAKLGESLVRERRTPSGYPNNKPLRHPQSLTANGEMSDFFKNQADIGTIDVPRPPYESSLFSSSLSDLLERRLKFGADSANNRHFAGNVEEPIKSLEDIEAQTIGNLLPKEEDLLSDLTYQKGYTDPNMDDLDLFSSVGGLEMGEDRSPAPDKDESSGLTTRQVPSRTLLIRNIDRNLEDSDLKALFEHYGSIRCIDTASKKHDFVLVSYFDIRAAKTAMESLQDRQLHDRNLDIHYLSRKLSDGNGVDQGAVVIYDIDPSVSNKYVSQVFGVYGDIKEIREIPGRSSCKCVEFFDIRCAEAALNALNRIQDGFPNRSMPKNPSKYEKFERGVLLHQNGSSNNLISGFPALAMENGKHFSPSLDFSYSHGLATELFIAEPRVTSGIGPLSRGSGSHPSHHRVWNPSLYHDHPSVMYSSSPSLGNGAYRSSPQFSQTPSHVNNHYASSAPTANPSFWDRVHSYVPESPDISCFHPSSLGNNALPPMEFCPKNLYPLAGTSHDMKSMMVQSQRGGFFPGKGHVGSFDPSTERTRRSRIDGGISPADKRHYELDLDRISRGEDSRTTLMIKNIPNKYTSKMLLAAIDERHKGTYDFIYLPIDFKNKCNVGYAFINMTDASKIISFYQSFNGKKWEKFNSEKVATLAYARIQGKTALVAHFQNSSLMNEDKRCRPILFCTDGPNAGDQVPFPMGSSFRSRGAKPQVAASDESQKTNVEDNVAFGVSSSASQKEP